MSNLQAEGLVVAWFLVVLLVLRVTIRRARRLHTQQISTMKELLRDLQTYDAQLTTIELHNEDVARGWRVCMRTGGAGHPVERRDYRARAAQPASQGGLG